MVGHKGQWQIVRHKKKLARQLVYETNLKNKEIIEGLKIPGSTFFWYRAKIIKEDAEVQKIVATQFDNPRYRFIELMRSLEEAIILNERIRDSDNSSPKLIRECSRSIIQYQTYLYQLSL